MHELHERSKTTKNTRAKNTRIKKYKDKKYKGKEYKKYIKSISDLRNYKEVHKEVRVNQPVYLTGNGGGAYAIVDMNRRDRKQQLSI